MQIQLVWISVLSSTIAHLVNPCRKLLHSSKFKTNKFLTVGSQHAPQHKTMELMKSKAPEAQAR